MIWKTIKELDRIIKNTGPTECHYEVGYKSALEDVLSLIDDDNLPICRSKNIDFMKGVQSVKLALNEDIEG